METGVNPDPVMAILQGALQQQPEEREAYLRSAGDIPAKIEGMAFGADVRQRGATVHTLWIANHNDFLETVADSNGNQIPNPNQFFAVVFTDSDLGGSQGVPQLIRPLF
jgi:hypothetical protein